MTVHAPFQSPGNPHAPFESPGGKLLKPGPYAARVPRATNQLFLASATSDVQVQLEVTITAATAGKVDIMVGGVKITGTVVPAAVATQSELVYSFIVNAGEEWKVEANAGIKEMFSNYKPLD